MIGFYIFLSVTAVVLGFVILSFFGPEHSEIPFWQAVHKIRAIIDKISYYIICTISIGILGLMVVAIVSSLIDSYNKNKSVTGVILSVVLIGIIGLLVGICIRNLVRDRKNNVRCECIGDCSKCKIQCQSNPNYYGMQMKGARNDAKKQ